MADRRERQQRQVIDIYLKTLRKNSAVFFELTRQADSTIKWCREKGYDEPKYAARVLAACSAQLDWITCREAEIKAIKAERDASQMPLAGIHEPLPAVNGTSDAQTGMVEEDAGNRSG